MRFACSITKAKNTRSEYVIIIAFPLQKLLHERIQYYVYVYCLCCGLLILKQPLSCVRTNMMMMMMMMYSCVLKLLCEREAY